jgi:hypothetical protein
VEFSGPRSDESVRRCCEAFERRERIAWLPPGRSAPADFLVTGLEHTAGGMVKVTLSEYRAVPADGSER